MHPHQPLFEQQYDDHHITNDDEHPHQLVLDATELLTHQKALP